MKHSKTTERYNRRQQRCEIDKRVIAAFCQAVEKLEYDIFKRGLFLQWKNEKEISA